MAELGIQDLKLYSGPLSMFGAKAEIAIREKGAPFHLEMVPFTRSHAYDPKHPVVLRVNPKRQVPVLIHGDLEIFDSTQIFEYLEDRFPDPPLWPAESAARARARLLELKSDEVFFPHVIRLMGLQDLPDDPASIAARDALAGLYGAMDGQLADGRDYLAGPYGFADIAFYMAQLFAMRMGAPMTEAHRHLIVWRDRMTARPAVSAVVKPMVQYIVATGLKLPKELRAFSDQQ
jgi:glutathione S-transferase